MCTWVGRYRVELMSVGLCVWLLVCCGNVLGLIYMCRCGCVCVGSCCRCPSLSRVSLLVAGLVVVVVVVVVVCCLLLCNRLVFFFSVSLLVAASQSRCPVYFCLVVQKPTKNNDNGALRMPRDAFEQSFLSSLASSRTFFFHFRCFWSSWGFFPRQPFFFSFLSRRRRRRPFRYRLIFQAALQTPPGTLTSTVMTKRNMDGRVVSHGNTQYHPCMSI